jgi:FkbM family methyltransferase
MADIQGLRDKYKLIKDERFFAELFDAEEYKAIKDRKLDVVIDIGALAGEFPAYVYEKAGIIHAIEPYKPHYKELLDNVMEYGLNDKVACYPVAIADYNGLGWFRTNDLRGGNNLAPKGSSKGQVVVPVNTLANFMFVYGITHVDLLKIDIEGNEVQVFGSKDFEDVAPLIDCIIGEHLSSFIEQFEKLGFTYRHVEGANMLFERL